MEHHTRKHLVYSCFFVQHGQKVYNIYNPLVNTSEALARAGPLHPPTSIEGSTWKKVFRQGSVILYFSKVHPHISIWFGKQASPKTSLVTRGGIPIVWK